MFDVKRKTEEQLGFNGQWNTGIRNYPNTILAPVSLIKKTNIYLS
jgi:hypothetical protein